MSIDKTKEDFRAIIEQYPQAVQEMAVALRALLFKIHADVFEQAWVKQKVAGYGVGPKKMTEHYCYMVFAKAHINFGFNHGVNLKDPKGLLGGTGKKFRNTKIKSIDDIHHPDLEALIREAIEERKDTLKK